MASFVSELVGSGFLVHARPKLVWAAQYTGPQEDLWFAHPPLCFRMKNHLMDQRAVDVAKHKPLTAALLAQEGLPVPAGRSFAVSDVTGAVAWAQEIGWPVVVKPDNGRQGRGVTMGVRDTQALAEAFARAGSKRILVQPLYAGRLYRILASPRRVLAAYYNVPAHVRGDGVSSVRELVEVKNLARAANPHLGTPKRRVRLEREALGLLAEQGLGVDAVPAAGRRVELSRLQNPNAGTDTVAVTDELHPGLVDLACRAVAAVPGLHTSGIDVLLPAGHTVDPAAQDTVILEHNSGAVLGGHLYPWAGTPRNVYRLMVEDEAQRRVLSLPPRPEQLDVLVGLTPARSPDDALWSDVEGVEVVDASEHGADTVRLSGGFTTVACMLDLMVKRSEEVLAVRADLAGNPFMIPAPEGRPLRLPTLTPCPWLPPLPTSTGPKSFTRLKRAARTGARRLRRSRG